MTGAVFPRLLRRPDGSLVVALNQAHEQRYSDQGCEQEPLPAPRAAGSWLLIRGDGAIAIVSSALEEEIQRRLGFRRPSELPPPHRAADTLQEAAA